MGNKVNMPASLQNMVAKQVARVLERGSRAERFDQLRQRHFWSSYLFIATPGTHIVQAGQFDIFKVIPGGTGQGYPGNTPLTLRETNWLNGGRVPDNQNFVITEIGVTVKRPPATDNLGASAVPNTPPANGIWAGLTAAQQAYITGGAQNREINSFDAYQILMGTVLEFTFLTNSVPLGLCADFSQSGGSIAQAQNGSSDTGGDPLNGVACAAFRRKLEVPILLQHGENMGMRLNVPRNIELTDPATTGTGWYELRVDWWASESFSEKS